MKMTTEDTSSFSKVMTFAHTKPRYTLFFVFILFKCAKIDSRHVKIIFICYTMKGPKLSEKNVTLE
jgi:hypothetical protein